MNHFLVFGSHPRLSLAEFKAIRPRVPHPILTGPAAMVRDPEWEGDVLMDRLGGTVKLGDVVAEFPVSEITAETIADAVLPLTAHGSRLDFGWTVYGGARGTHERLSRLAIPFKKELKARGTPSRWVTAERGKDISPAAVAKLKLTTDGLDVCLLVHGGTVALGLTTDVQDADAWSRRDYGRPARDELTGMLPPKLARMMVNLASIPHGGTILDPFCGGGSILMEAALATDAAVMIGSDIEAKQVGATEKNLGWLRAERILRAEDAERFRLMVADARSLGRRLKPSSVDRVVTEGYLGPPLRGHESAAALKKTASEISSLWNDALTALRPVLRPHARIVGIWPSFKSSHGTARVELDREIEALGYRLIDPLGDWETSRGPLIYQRPDQRIARRIVILETDAG